MLRYLFLVAFIAVSSYSYAKVWLVNPESAYQYCSQVNNLVADGDTIEIQNSIYENDKQVTWSKNDLLIRGINGRPVLKAGSIIASDNSNGKGIFVIRGNNTIVENIEFQNCKVQSRNGAGIRQEGSNLIVRNCVFKGNEMGILQGGTIPNCSILVEFCEFLSNGSPDNPGYQHNIYINHIDTLIFRYNLSIDAIAQGHEFKSRANVNYILYNRISNLNSVDSRNIDIPNGGETVIMGNIIEQSENSANTNIIGYGMEGLTNLQPHNIWIANNTIVNRMSKGNFLQVGGQYVTVYMMNNICVGAKTGGFITGDLGKLDTLNNIISDDINYPKFVDLEKSNFHLTEDSPAINSGIKLDAYYVMGDTLIPRFEYKEIADFVPRTDDGKIDIGAYEYNQPQFVDVNATEDIYFYPNPANDFLKVNFDGIDIQQIKILDINGEEVLNFNNPYNNQLIDLRQLPNGTYFISFASSDETINKKLLILRD